MYAKIRLRNLSWNEVDQADVHNFRKHDELGFEKPINVKSSNKWMEMGYQNSDLITENYGEVNTLKEAIENCFNERKIYPRKGAVVALEYVIGLSTEVFDKINKQNYILTSVLSRLEAFLIKKHGAENIISSSYHFDETTPHAHIIVVPVSKKKTKWDLRKEAKEGIVLPDNYRLCAKDFSGGPKLLTDLQNDFYNFSNNFTTSRFGINLTKHVPVKEQNKEYQEKTDHRLGEIKENLRLINEQIEALDGKSAEYRKAFWEKAQEEIRKAKELKEEIELSKPPLTDRQIKDINWHKTNMTESQKPLKPIDPKPNQAKGEDKKPNKGMSM
jgi:hypothetical protein